MSKFFTCLHNPEEEGENDNPSLRCKDNLHFNQRFFEQHVNRADLKMILVTELASYSLYDKLRKKKAERHSLKHSSLSIKKGQSLNILNFIYT